MKFFTALLLIFAAILAVSAQDVFSVLSDNESNTESVLSAGDAACLGAGLNLRWAPCGNTFEYLYFKFKTIFLHNF